MDDRDFFIIVYVVLLIACLLFGGSFSCAVAAFFLAKTIYE